MPLRWTLTDNQSANMITNHKPRPKAKRIQILTTVIILVCVWTISMIQKTWSQRLRAVCARITLKKGSVHTVLSVSSPMVLTNWESISMRTIPTRLNPAMHSSRKVIANMATDATSSTAIHPKQVNKQNGERFTLTTEISSRRFEKIPQADYPKYCNDSSSYNMLSHDIN